MSPPAVVNESAATLAWLLASLGDDRNEPAGAVTSAWNDVRDGMRRAAGAGQIILQSVDWVSDFWVARGAAVAPFGGQLAPHWMPPERLDAWPAFDAGEVVAALPCKRGRSNHRAFCELLERTAAPADAAESAAAALARYLDLKSGLVPRVFDVPAVQTEHARLWLGTSLGHLLMSVALTPPGDPDAFEREILYRLGLPQQVGLHQGIVDQLGDRHLELLYNTRMLPDRRVRLSRVRSGQGEEWRDHWVSLGFEIGAEETIEAVRMAAGLLRCGPLVSGLQRALASGEGATARLAVGVVRRWILTLKAMAWLEAALGQSWRDVRAADLCAIALNATKPEWPRRVLAISHRSKDVKPTLRTMELWREGRCAIDANYVPSWETNIGMIWGLFAATPAVVRVHSPAYRESVWCRREFELSSYLLERSDFLTERWILDIDLSEVRALDAVADGWNERDPESATVGLMPQFPPLIEICSPAPMPAWQASMYRAGAALRLVHAVLAGATPQLVNGLALHLQRGGELPGTAPTNNPDGWRDYGAVFREASERCECGPEELAVRLPDDYDETQRARDLETSQRIPDLQAGTPSLGDVLVAMEWLRVEWPQYLERNRGDFLAINCQRLTEETWRGGEGVSLHRGLAGMRRRLPTPLWVIQRGDQDVEAWPLLGEMPIFTEHVSQQFAWMLEVSFDTSDSLSRYPDDSGLVLSPTLLKLCRAG